MVAEVKLRQLLWESVESWEKYVEDWTTNSFASLSPEEMSQTIARFMKNVVQFEKGLPENFIVPKLRNKVERIKDKVDICIALSYYLSLMNSLLIGGMSDLFTS